MYHLKMILTDGKSPDILPEVGTKSFLTKGELFSELSRLMDFPITETSNYLISHSSQEIREKELKDFLAKRQISIHPTGTGYLLKKKALPPFEVFTTPGSLVERFLAKGKTIKWEKFLDKGDQKGISKWRRRRAGLRNPACVILGYSYSGVDYSRSE